MSGVVQSGLSWLLPVVVLIIVLVPSLGEAAPISLNISKINYVVDGDTFAVITTTNHRLLSQGRYLVRIKGIDTPEYNGSCAMERELSIEAKNLLISYLDDGFSGEDRIEIISHYRDRYGRLVADVLVHTSSGRVINIGEKLLDSGLALPYSVSGHASSYNKYWCSSK